MKRINGYIAAPFTPMRENGALNLNVIPNYADFLLRNGLDGAFVCGSTGEGALLTLEERMAIAEEWMKYSRPNFKIIIHTGGTNLTDQQQLARHASDIGAFAIASMAPAFLPPQRNQELVQYCRIIAEAAPDLPFYYYHIPSLNNFNLSVVDLLKSADGEISNFAGVKYTHNDLSDLNQCLFEARGKFEILNGCDEIFLGALTMGVKSGIGGSYNHCFTLYKELSFAFSNNDLDKCRELQYKSQLFIGILKKYRGNIVCGKRIMKMLGLDCGPNRLPLQTIHPVEEKEVKEMLNKIGFFDFCNS